MRKQLLSLCVICRNDEAHVARLVRSARRTVDEIVIVDTGSVDNSVNAAKTAGADVVVCMPELLDDGTLRSFSEAREESFALATCPWLMWLDTDDDVSNWHELRRTVEGAESFRNEHHVEGMAIELHYDYSWTPDRTRCCQTFTRERIVHRDDAWHWKRPVHEYLDRDGQQKRLRLTSPRVVHMSDGARGVAGDRNLKILRRWERENAGWEPEVLMYYLGDETFFRKKFRESFEYFNSVPRNFVWKPRAALRAARAIEATGDVSSAISYLADEIRAFEEISRKDTAHLYWELSRLMYGMGKLTLANELMTASEGKTPIVGEDPLLGHYVSEMLKGRIRLEMRYDA